MNKWEQWLESKEGKKALEPSILRSPQDQQYLINRLFWAFHAGVYPITGRLETKAEALLKEVAGKDTQYLPKQLRNRIRTYLNTL